MNEIFKNIFELLSEKEKETISSTNIDSFEKLIPILLKRVCSNISSFYERYGKSNGNRN